MQREIKEAAALIDERMKASAELSLAPRPGLQLWRVTERSPVTPMTYEPMLCVLAQGRKRAHLGEGPPREYGPGHYLVSTQRLPVCAEILEASPQRPLLGMSVTLDIVVLGDLVREMGDEEEAPSDVAPAVFEVPPLDAAFTRTLIRLLEVSDSDLDWRVLSPGLLRELHYHALRGAAGGHLRERVRRSGSAERVARAIHFIGEHFTEPLTVEAIARSADLSPSSLHARFREATSLSPIQYLKRVRLLRAHALLIGGTSVADASRQVGYGSPSQFSREFRREFGLSPSQARQAPGALEGA